MLEQVGPYPEELASTLDVASPSSNNGADADKSVSDAPTSSPARANAKATRNPQPIQPEEPLKEAGHEAQPASVAQPGHCAAETKREVRVDVEPPMPAPNLADSPVRRVVGKPVRLPSAGRDEPAPEGVRELAFFDRINEVGPADQLKGVNRLPRLYEADYAILKLLDRAGLAPRALIARATMPDRSANAVNDRLVKLYRHGLVAQHAIGIRRRTRADGTLPKLYSLTRRGLQVGQARQPVPAISSKREWRPLEQSRAARVGHDLHALSWAIAFHRAVGRLATDNWRTPRYATGRYPVQQIGSGQRRHPIKINEIPLPDGQAMIDLELTAFGEIKPDLSLEVRIEAIKLTFDLLVELDLTARPSYNRDKLLAYDAFLCGWCLAHPRYRTLQTRPIVLFVCRDERALLGLAKVADEALTGRMGLMGTPAEQWYFPAREHVYFAIETDVHSRRLTALSLPKLPPDIREKLNGDRELALAPVSLLPETIVAAAAET
jgi:hypothetical protein